MASSSHNEDENIPLSQVMPIRLRDACNDRRSKIRELKKSLLSINQRKLEIQEAIKQKKQEMKMQRKALKEAEAEVYEIKENYEGLEDMINEKAKWIEDVQYVYPYHNW